VCQLDAAATIEDLRNPPGNRLDEPLFSAAWRHARLQRIRQELIDDESPQAAASAPTLQLPRHAGITLASFFVFWPFTSA
jgi:hypothetical protein